MRRIQMALLSAFVMLVVGQCVQAKSIVYIFLDNPIYAEASDSQEQVFVVDGNGAFSLTVEKKKEFGKKHALAGMCVFKRAMRKVVFQESGSYVLYTEHRHNGNIANLQINLNLQDDETYYVAFKGVSVELLGEKDGQKHLSQAIKGGKYTINEPYVYEKK